MIAPTHATLVDRFLDNQRWRHTETPKLYGSCLRGFQRFVAQHNHNSDQSPSVWILQQWLKERSLHWRIHHLCHQALIVERYLRWQQDQGVIAESPFVSLHRQYGAHTTPIVRALVQQDANTALEQLRALPRFASHLGQMMKEHVAHMRSLGYRYRTNEELLLRFDRFLQRHTESAQLPLDQLVERWSAEQPSAVRLYEAQRVGRIVSKAMHRLDSTVPVLAVEPGVARAARQGNRRAHIYSDEQIRRILACALSYPSANTPLRPLSLFTMLMLAYCAGLRGGEIARLRLADVDLRGQSIEIRETKFFKYRRLPLPPSVTAALARYLNTRANAGAPTSQQSDLFWTPQTGRGYSLGTIRLMLTDVLRRAGVKPPRGAVGPRVHDLRHTMVGHRMRDWYKSGLNPQSKLPYLATYLGHKDIRSTLAYLNITPELLQQAGERLRKHGAAALTLAED